MPDTELQLREYWTWVVTENPTADAEQVISAVQATSAAIEPLHQAPETGVVMRPVGEKTRSPLRQRRLRGAWAVAVAALVIVLLVGGVAWLSRSSPEIDPDDPPVITQAPTETTVPTVDVPLVVNTVLLGPGGWSVAATFPDGTVPAEQLSAAANEMRSWPGVLEVAEVADEAAWLQLTGLESDCNEGNGPPPCGAGIVALTTSTWMDHTAQRLEAEFGMTAITPLDVPTAFWNGYTSTISDMSPIPLGFDPTSLGVEVRTTMGPACPENTSTPGETSITLDGCPAVGLELGVGLQVEVEGVVVHREANFYGEFDSGDVLGLLIDGFGRGGAFADFVGFTELDGVAGPRRIYFFAGLPIDAAVVTFELADGTRVWQRPVGGMALIVDKVGSMPERFVEEEDDLGLANPLVVLDSDGDAIMRIEDAGDGFSVVTDLRVDPDAISKSREAPVFVPDAASSLAGKIAYVSSEGIMILDLDRGFTSQLTDRPGLDFSPSLSPDGTRIAFVSDRDASDFPEAAHPDAAYVYDIYVMDADGSNVVRLTDTGGFDVHPGWSPDGTRIVFVSERSGNGEIYVMDPDGSDVVVLTDLGRPTGGGAPTWSPDGTRILFANDRDLYVMDADGSNLIQLTHSAENPNHPAWSPDGTRIAFAGGRNIPNDASQVTDIYVMGADGSNIVRIDSDPVAGASHPAWSPDGQLIAYVRGPADPVVFQLYVMDVDGSNAIQITNLPAQEPTWSR